MADVFPFRGEVYNQERVDIASVVTPPYDVISKEEQEEYYQKSPYNIIRLILGREDDRYTKAKERLKDWRKNSIFIEDEKECFYLYEQEWEIFGEKGTFRGIVVSISLEDYSSGIILPHERILPKPKNDRLKLLSSCKTNFSPVFLLCPDNEEMNSIGPENPPFIEFEYKKGLFCRLARIEKTEGIEKAFQDKRLFIADGHHRYDTSLTYFKETKEKERKRRMALISSIGGGFKILPAHRVLKNPPDMGRIKQYFNIEEEEKEEIFSSLSERKEIGVFGMLGRDFSFIISPKDSGLLNKIKEELRVLDVSILHELLFDGIDLEEEIEYTIDRDLVFKRVEDGATAFLLRPTSVSDVIRIASSGNRMPGKATYFYPKPFCGLVIHPLRCE